jgi:DNA polymerase-3 subunit epsilon
VSSKPVFAAFDLETTGLVAGVDRIVELAAVLFRTDEVLDTWTALVDPGIPIPPDAGGVNGITDGMVRGQPRIDSVLRPFLGFLSRGAPVAHNAVFDVGFVCADMREEALEPPPGPVLDTRTLARRAFPGRYSYSLSSLARDFKLRGDESAHRALADAQTCRRLFLACARELGAERELSVDELAAMSGPLDFAAHAPRQQITATLLERARVDGGEVEIEYHSGAGETTRRRIRPLTFTRVGANIAVVAYCSLRKANRTFVLESIASVRPAP